MSKCKQTTMAEYFGTLLKANERGHLAVPNKVWVAPSGVGGPLAHI